MLMCGFFAYALAHETAGAARTRSSLRPLIFGASEFAKLGRSVSRECPRSSSSAKADDPVFRGVNDGSENSRCTTCLRGYDGGGWSIAINVIARSACDEAIQLFLVVLDCFAIARNDGCSRS